MFLDFSAIHNSVGLVPIALFLLGFPDQRFAMPQGLQYFF